MCQSTDLRVANGRTKGEPAGRFVVSSRPKSNDIDYYIEYKRNVVELSQRQICHFNEWSDILLFKFFIALSFTNLSAFYK